MARQMAGAGASVVKQTFRFSDPSATSVMLVGDFTHWQDKGIQMHKGKDGIWTASVQLGPGQYNYRFLVDGQWRDDPECKLRVSNPYGSQNMIRSVA
jgi:1,4-alpha-glucan branching enzyme